MDETLCLGCYRQDDGQDDGANVGDGYSLGVGSLQLGGNGEADESGATWDWRSTVTSIGDAATKVIDRLAGGGSGDASQQKGADVPAVQPTAGSGGVLGFLTQPTPIFDLPVWAVALGGWGILKAMKK